MLIIMIVSPFKDYVGTRMWSVTPGLNNTDNTINDVLTFNDKNICVYLFYGWILLFVPGQFLSGWGGVRVRYYNPGSTVRSPGVVTLLPG